MSLVLEYFAWWYTDGFIRLLKYLKAFVVVLADNFSVRVILRTFFQPWKRDIASTKGLSLDKRFQVWVGNLIARVFGMIIKGITFVIFLLFFIVLIVFELLIFIVWLLFPIIILGALGYTIYRLFI